MSVAPQSQDRPDTMHEDEKLLVAQALQKQYTVRIYDTRVDIDDIHRTITFQPRTDAPQSQEDDLAAIMAWIQWVANRNGGLLESHAREGLKRLEQNRKQAVINELKKVDPLASHELAVDVYDHIAKLEAQSGILKNAEGDSSNE